VSHHKIEMKNVSFAYPNGENVLSDVSFCINHGESVGILGENGAGKSTLLLLLTGVLTAGNGEIIIGDTRLTAKTLGDIRRHLGLIFQNPDDQLFMNTIGEDVAFGPRNMGLSENEVETRVTNALGETSIPHLRSRAPYRVSGGEKRAAAVASVLSMKPDALILDEPTSALDPKARRRTIELLRGFSHTKIIASHDIDMIYELCERVIIIKDGKITEDGDTRKIVIDPFIMDENGLEIPLFMQSFI